MSGQAPTVRKFSMLVPAVAAGSDETTTVCEAPFAGKVASVSYVPDTTITGANTDTRKVELINKGQSGSGTTVAATLQFNSGVNATAFDEKDITLSSTAADLVVAAGDVLAFKSTHIGSTWLADPGGTVWVEISRT